MRERCEVCVPWRFEIVGVEVWHGAEDFEGVCLREHGHMGPHLFLRAAGEYVRWEDDICSPDECHCGFWEDSGDPDDICITFSTVTGTEVKKFITDATYEG